ncbi:aminoethylphosphonate catabolism associated LysR family transcriptional regulator [compost metagenome]
MLSQLQDMDLQLLRIFVTIVDCGGFSAAQGKLGIAQSTISTQMAKLEIRVGFRLCERGKSGFRLTAKGERVYQSARKLFDAVGSFTRETQAVSDTLIGELKIGLSELLAPEVLELLGQCVGRYRQRTLDVTIEIITATPDVLEAKLLNDEIQLAIGYFSKSQASLNYETLFQERQTLFCGKAHPLFQKTTINNEDVNRAEKVSHVYRVKSLGARFVSERQTAISEQVDADLIFILSGAHISFLPEHIATPWVAEGKLRPLLREELSYEVDFQMATAKKRDNVETLELFKHYLIEVFSGSR